LAKGIKKEILKQYGQMVSIFKNLIFYQKEFVLAIIANCLLPIANFMLAN
jgi:hypothetical protein